MRHPCHTKPTKQDLEMQRGWGNSTSHVKNNQLQSQLLWFCYIFICFSIEILILNGTTLKTFIIIYNMTWKNVFEIEKIYQIKTKSSIKSVYNWWRYRIKYKNKIKVIREPPPSWLKMQNHFGKSVFTQLLPKIQKKLNKINWRETLVQYWMTFSWYGNDDVQ